jgi:hypothetical protein
MFGQFTIPGGAGCKRSSMVAIAVTLPAFVVVNDNDGLRPG